MKKSKNTVHIEQPNIVEDFYIGGTRIRIADNYCRDKNSEEIKKSLDRIAEIAVNNFINQQKSSTE